MPNKGFFTQGAVILFESLPALDALESALSEFEIRGRRDASDEWAMSGPSLLLPYRPDANGAVAVDVVSRAWPDHMGDPENEAMLFGAWSMGHFGPGAFPGGLQRAVQNCWHWEGAPAVAQRHTSFVRIRTSYAFGAGPDDPVIPPEYDPLAELLFSTAVSRAVLNTPGALCYFNPNGEMLHSAEAIDRGLGEHRETGTVPQDLWCNVRMLRLADHEPWMLMDTVGMDQLDRVDHEAIFTDAYDPSHVAGFLRSVADYILQRGPVIRDGHTASGPGDVDWQARNFSEPIYQPPRDVMRWLPLDGVEPPGALVGDAETVH
ncbi:MAG: DUF4261 domain-containing protein [Myxococcales bacterium]|nr:DUF4261 domain-containing protein [Myxococcales bacterium]